MSDAEPVLNVPAISYAEIEEQQRERAKAMRATPKRRASTRLKGAAGSKDRSAPARKRAAKRGEVGPAVVAAVEAKIAGGLNASQAFEVVAKERGMNAGAVSANYYRMKRNQSKVTKTSSATKRSAPRGDRRKVSPRPVTSGGARRRSVAAGEAVDIHAMLANLTSNVQALLETVTQHGTEIAELRSRLGQVGSTLGG